MAPQKHRSAGGDAATTRQIDYTVLATTRAVKRRSAWMLEGCVGTITATGRIFTASSRASSPRVGAIGRHVMVPRGGTAQNAATTRQFDYAVLATTGAVKGRIAWITAAGRILTASYRASSPNLCHRLCHRLSRDGTMWRHSRRRRDDASSRLHGFGDHQSGEKANRLEAGGLCQHHNSR